MNQETREEGSTFTSNSPMATALLFLLLLGATLIFLNSRGTYDRRVFERWMATTAEHGLVQGYAESKWDYPPLAYAILHASNQIVSTFQMTTFHALKIAIFCFLVLTSAVFWLWTRDPVATAVLHLALLFNSLGLAYVDVFVGPAVLLAFWALHERHMVLFAICFTVACLIKWQPMILAPFLAVYVMDVRNFRWRNVLTWLTAIVPALGTLALVVWLFNVTPVLAALQYATSHDYLSGNALNLPWIMTHFLRVWDPAQYGPLVDGQAELIRTRAWEIRLVPKLLFAACYLGLLAIFFLRRKSYRQMLLFCIAGYMGYYIFNTGVHENHLFLTVLLGMLLCQLNRQWTAITFGIILIFNVNMFVFFGPFGGAPDYSRVILGIVDLALLLSVANIVFYLYLLYVVVTTAEMDEVPGPETEYGGEGGPQTGDEEEALALL